MSKALVEFTEKLVPISDFSQGKAGKIFNDVAKNNSEYIVLKNNQPTAVLLSIKEYKETQEKLDRHERILEYMENIRLLKLAEERKNSKMTSFEEFVAEEGYSMEELKKLAESVEVE
jgi:prevent-host-death family protein